MSNNQKALCLLYQHSFTAFVIRAFEELYGRPISSNWHIEAVCYYIRQILTWEQPKRLIYNQPPRSLKSFIVSIYLPAWILGLNPRPEIVCASYAEDLALKFSRDCRTLMETKFYRKIFPETRISRQKNTETEFETTKKGCRYTASVNGTLTGRGCEFLIVDDPLKAKDGSSGVARRKCIEWFRNTTFSRMNNRADGIIIIAMQRIHEEYLSGIFIKDDWPTLVLPAIAEEDKTYRLGGGRLYTRKKGEILQPSRDSTEDMEQAKRDHGSSEFAAQFQQNPTPQEGNMIRRDWVRRHTEPLARGHYSHVYISVDPALGNGGADPDNTAIVVIGIKGIEWHILAVAKSDWTPLEMARKIQALAEIWRPGITVIESTASGPAVAEDLRVNKRLTIVLKKASKFDKCSRVDAQRARIEAGRLFLPHEAPWLADFEHELFGYPRTSYDDQIDAVILGIEYCVQMEDCQDVIIDPIIIYGPRDPMC